jgi:hypothetical protein
MKSALLAVFALICSAVAVPAQQTPPISDQDISDDQRLQRETFCNAGLWSWATGCGRHLIPGVSR